MELVDVRLVLRPEATRPALSFVAAVVGLGTVSGLTPGIHANTFALLLAAAASTVPGPPRFVGAAMLAAGVVHTFLDVDPGGVLDVGGCCCPSSPGCSAHRSSWTPPAARASPSRPTPP